MIGGGAITELQNVPLQTALALLPRPEMAASPLASLNVQLHRHRSEPSFLTHKYFQQHPPLTGEVVITDAARTYGIRYRHRRRMGQHVAVGDEHLPIIRQWLATSQTLWQLYQPELSGPFASPPGAAKLEEYVARIQQGSLHLRPTRSAKGI
jgi:hypothetical protein